MAKTSKRKEDHEEESMKKNIQKRFEGMFTGSGEPLTNMSIHEVEALKSRVAELETQLTEQRAPSSNDTTIPSAFESAFHASKVSDTKPVPSLHKADTLTLEKRIGLWVTGISAAVGLAFFGVALYIILVLQSGAMDLSDKVLTPLAVLMAVAGAIGMSLVQRNRLVPGLWAPYLINVILAPILIVLVLQGLQVVAGVYLGTLSLIFIALVLPRSTKAQAVFVALGAALVIAGIEIWNPVFRLTADHIQNFVPLVVGPAAVGILATFIVVYQSRNPGIQSRLTTLVMVIMIPLLVGISLFVTSLTNARIEAGAHTELQGTSLSLASTVSTWLRLNTSALHELTLQPDIVDMDAERQRPVLEAMAEAYPYMYLVSTTGLDGMNIARNDNAELTDYSDREWFRAASTGLPVSYQSLIGRTTGQPALVVSMPIWDTSGQIVGVGMLAVDLTNLAEETRVSRLGERGFTYIVDANNQALAHPDTAYTADLRDMSAYPPVVALRQGQTGLIKFTDENGESWRAYGSLLDNGWAIIAQRPESEILAPARQFQIIVFLLILAGGAVMLILTWLTIRRTLQPIHILTDTVSAIAAGDLHRVVEVNSHDEIGKLAHTFNGMTRQLRGLVESLEQRVMDRTHDLELASEVGRTITEKVANAGEMLTTAAELIRSRFELYYTQVYLIDSTGQRLILHAGTGEVGEQLLNRGHRLLINSSSLNGQAVLEKKPVIVADTLQSASFKPNPLLPKTRSEMAVPLIANGQVIGVLDMQSEQPGALTENNMTAFEALAGQLAIAIQNANLFAEAQEARSEVEAQMRRFTEQGWQDFLNAIDRGQKIAFAFEKSTVSRLQPDEVSDVSAEDNINIPITVTGTKIGEIHLPVEANRTWMPNEIELIHATSAHLAQHVENLRLLAQAEHFQKEAEQAVRRLTQEGWNDYLTSGNKAGTGYVYDLHQVQPLSEAEQQDAYPLVKQPLVVGSETVGELGLDLTDVSEETAGIISAVAQQLSGHIENLRLLEQTEQQRGQLSEALKTSRLAYWEYDFVNDVFTFNDQFYDILLTTAEREGGYTMPAARYAERFVYPEDIPVVGAEIQKAVETTDPNYSVQIDHRIIYGNGEIGYFNVRFHIEKDAAGRTVRSYGANQDITERKKAEDIVRESEARLSEALNIAKLANWEYDVERDRFLFNDHFYSIFHTTAECVGGYELSSEDYARLFVHPDDMPIVGEEIGKALASTDRHYSVKLEHRIQFADGGMGYISVDIHIERDENGKITRYYGANQDITERKRAEEAIKAEQQRTQTILESVTVPMVITRLSDNHLTFVNTPALEVTRFSYDQVINQPTPNFYANLDDRTKFVTSLRAKGEVADMVVQLLRANGEAFWALMSAKIFDYQAEPSILTTFMDISDRIRAQEAVAKRATELATVAQVSTTASTVLDPDRLLQSVVDLTKERFALYHAHIYLLSPEQNALVLTAGSGEVGREMLAEGWKIPVDHDLSIIADAYRRRQSVVANDVYHDKESTFLSNRLLPDTRSELALPLLVGDRVLGVFDVQSEKVSYFTEEDINIYTTLASQVSVALQNARLFDQTEEALNWQKAINQTSIMIGQAKTIEDIVRATAELLPLLGMLSCSVSVVTESDAVGVPTQCDIHIVRFAENQFIHMPPVLGQPTAGWLPDEAKYYQESRVTVFPNLEDLSTIVPSTAYKAEAAVEYMLKVGMRSAIALALGVHKRAIGYLTFTSRTPLVHVPEKYIAWLSSVVDLIAAAIDNQLLFNETERGRQALSRRAAELATVASVSTTVSTVLDPDQLLQSVVDLTKDKFDLYHVHIYLANESWDTLLLASGAGEVGRKLVTEQHAIPMSLEQSLVARAARERKAVIVNNVKAEPGFLPNPLLPETCAEMAVPMTVGDRLLGVFDVQSNNEAGFSQEDANIYVTLATQVGVALQNARLYVEQAATLAQLRELDRLKSSFLANMSHELRTPLNSILGFTDVMMEGLDGPLTEFMDNDLRLIQKNGQHLLHLINDVLDMAKIEAGRMNLNPESFKAFEVLEEVTSITSTLASEKNLSLFIDETADREIKLYADRTRLRQVMINLVNNSIKFTEKGEVTLHVAPMDGGRVLISVRDTGLGIPPEKLEAIFQEFTQVDSSTTRKTGGTGLGLPISRRLVEMHGGRLWADSTGIPGEGSIFFVELPLEARITEVVEKQEK